MALLEKRRGGGVASATCVGEQFAFGDVSRQFRVSVGLCGVVAGGKKGGMKKECRGRVCVFVCFFSGVWWTGGEADSSFVCAV